MEKVYDKCCGIDVHKKVIVACFRKGNRQEIRDFGATTRELLEMADWLKEGGCEMAAMESTASYWKPLYNIPESCRLKAMVVNARHMKAVPGRKTDVKDAEWIANLLQHGLLQASYIPDRDQRELRELIRYRKSLVGERNRELNRLRKMLEGANIKISGTITDINGKSARNILEYILSGKQIDSAEYDILYEKKVIAHNLKATKEQIIDDLNGVMSQLQRKMMKILLSHLDELNKHITELDDDIDNFMKPEEKEAANAIQDIPGIGNTSAQAIIAVIGTDMGRFATDAHIASWAGLCPGNNESAHKRKSGKTRKGNALLRETLVVCAHSAVKNKNTYFSAQFARISAHRGKKRAYVAVAHSMPIAIYHIIKDGAAFRELGADYYNQFNKERKINAYLKKLKALGDEYLFYTVRQGVKSPMSPDNVARFLNKYEIMMRQDLPDIPHLHPHLFRHTRAMHLYQAGMPLAMVSEWLGHSQLETTLIYAHADTEMKRRAVEKVSSAENSVFTNESFKYADDEEMIKKLYGLA